MTTLYRLYEWVWSKVRAKGIVSYLYYLYTSGAVDSLLKLLAGGDLVYLSNMELV